MDRDTSYSPKYCEIMWVGRDLAGHHIPPPTWHCPAQHWATSPCTMSTSPSSPSRAGGTAPTQGHHPRASQPSQSRNFSLHPTYTPPWHNRRPFPHVPSLTAQENKNATNWLQSHQIPANTVLLAITKSNLAGHHSVWPCWSTGSCWPH